MPGNNHNKISHNRCSSAYNVLLGRPSLNAIKAIPSAYHMVIKFPTTNEIRMVQGDQRVARECYSASMKQKAVDNIYVDELDMRDEVSTRPEPSEEMEAIPLDDHPEHLAYVGSKLVEDLRSPLIRFLKQNNDVFAWKQEDMGRIDPTIITHKLSVNLSFKPVKQKRISFALERQKAINMEVGKLLQAGAIREVEYPEWLANVVLIKKENGKWRLCIDFTDVNRACPKDSFPLPRIDLIVDATVGHELLSFMDAFLLQLDQHGSRRPREDLIHHWARDLLLSGNALWTKKRRSYLPEVGEQDLPETNRDIYGGIYRRHVSKINYGQAPYSSSGRGIPDLEKVQHEVESNQMRFRSLSWEILGFYSQQMRNRGKPRQDKSCGRHAGTIKHKRSPTPNWKNSCVKPFCV